MPADSTQAYIGHQYRSNGCGRPAAGRRPELASAEKAEGRGGVLGKCETGAERGRSSQARSVDQAGQPSNRQSGARTARQPRFRRPCQQIWGLLAKTRDREGYRRTTAQGSGGCLKTSFRIRKTDLLASDAGPRLPRTGPAQCAPAGPDALHDRGFWPAGRTFFDAAARRGRDLFAG